MTYCSECGADVPQGTLYCSNCGSQIEGQIQQPSQPENYIEVPKYASNQDVGRQNVHSSIQKPVRRSKAGKIVAIVLIVLIVSSGASFLASSHKYDLQADRTYAYGSETIPTNLAFDFDVGSAEVIFQFNSSPVEDFVSIDASFDFSYRGGEERSLEEIYTIDWETSESLVYFHVYQEDWFNWAMWDQTVITVSLRTDIVYDLDIDTGSGNIIATIPKNVNFVNLDIHTGSGSIDLYLDENSKVSSDLILNAGSGNIRLNINNTEVKNTVDISTGSGSLYLNIDGLNLTESLNLNTGSGSIDIVAVNSQLMGSINSDTGSGSVRYNLINTTLGGDLNVNIGSGGFSLISEDLSLLNDVYWDIDGSSGNINLDITQHHSLGGLISGNIETGSGRITTQLDMNSTTIPSNWECDVGSGDVEFDLNQSSEYNYADEILTSLSYDGTSGFNIYFETGSGGITIIA
ncbi:DUF4097 family beta strand repeat-containing protein [Candidatus Lokiarchaeum ossiferum]|uniref:DUF4097 family beta strand repeat-containing protein n=1 Tax=Candidatus Lokiarchaeum ossiferum TaxID=2951803 RepID=UPI00352CB1D6